MIGENNKCNFYKSNLSSNSSFNRVYEKSIHEIDFPKRFAVCLLEIVENETYEKFGYTNLQIYSGGYVCIIFHLLDGIGTTRMLKCKVLLKMSYSGSQNMSSFNPI